MNDKGLIGLIKEYETKFDLVGPRVDDDIRRAINRYGAQAVKDAVKRLTKPKRGRKAERDWPEIDKVIKEDARKWLEGGDPFADRSNYSIAQAYVNEHPGHSHAATQRRIMKKLAEKRVTFTLINAELIGRGGYPHEAYLRALRALTELRPDWGIWPRILSEAEANIADYTRKFGPIPPDMTMKEVEDGARNALLPASPTNSNSGLAGMFRAYMGDQR